MPVASRASIINSDKVNGTLSSAAEAIERLTHLQHHTAYSAYYTLCEAKTTFDRQDVVFLIHVVAVAFPQLPTLNAAKKALRQGRVVVDGTAEFKHDALAPMLGAQFGSAVLICKIVVFTFERVDYGTQWITHIKCWVSDC